VPLCFVVFFSCDNAGLVFEEDIKIVDAINHLHRFVQISLFIRSEVRTLYSYRKKIDINEFIKITPLLSIKSL